MSKNKLDDLSAFADGELSASETQFFASRLVHDQVLQESWQRVHLIRSCMQGSGAAGLDIRARVSSVIQAEPALDAPVKPKRQEARWLRPVAGMAVAASVAAATLMVLREPALSPADPLPLADTTLQQPSAGNEELVLIPTVAPPVSNVSLSSQQSNRNMQLRQYLLRHNEEAARGVFNYIYLTSQPQQLQTEQQTAAQPVPADDDVGGE